MTTRREDRIRAYLRHAPFALCLRELNRLLALEVVYKSTPPLEGPVLDVGCGDGFWWTQQDRRDVYGVDISATEVNRARRRIVAEVRDIARERPFPGVEFAEVVGNCSLEHIRDVNAALSNMRACLRTGGRLILFVPTVSWAYQGWTQGFLLRHAPRLAMTVAGALNGFFQHWHLYDLATWTHLLSKNGFRVTGSHGLGSPRAEFLFRLFLPVSFVSFLVKTLLGRYPSELLRLAPDALLTPMTRLAAWALEESAVPVESPDAYELGIVAEAE